MKPLILILTAGIVYSAFCQFLPIETERTSLVLEIAEAEGAQRAFLRHYGTRLRAEEMAALAWNRESSTEVGYEVPTAYAALGDAAGAGKLTFSGLNQYGGLAVIHADGCLTSDLAVESADMSEEGAKITWKDMSYGFSAIQHFRPRSDCDVIETWVELQNDEAGPVQLVRMDSLTLALPLVGDRFSLQTTTGQWTSEGQVVESEVVRGRTETFGARSGVRGAWGNNPSFMLSVGGGSTESHGRVLGAVLCWTGSWEASIRRSQTDFLEIRAGVSNFAGPYVLEKGARIVLPTVALTWSDDGKGQISRNVHRWARRYWMPKGESCREIILNNWEGTGFDFTEKLLDKVMDGAQAAGVEMFVLDDGWFGRGEFARNDDRCGLGDWVVNDAKLPRGLAELQRGAARRGLKFGLWVEPEMANTASAFYRAHPDWVLREKRRPLRKGRGESQVVLDLTNPQVREAVWSQLDAVYSSVPDLAYIKWDANADMTNLGSPHLPTDRQANLLYDYTQGYYELLSRHRAKYPGVRIQACSSGGGHVDYGSLRYCDEFWTSDDTDARERVMIQWGTSMFYPACSMSSHVTAGWGRRTPFKFRVDVASSGRLGIEMQPSKMSAEEFAFVKNAVAEYKRFRPVVQQGDLYRLVSPYERDYAALMYVATDRRSAVVFVYGLSRRMRQNFPPPLRLCGLDPRCEYRLRELNIWPGTAAHSKLLTDTRGYRALARDGLMLEGAALMGAGLPFTLGTDDYDSVVFELTAVED